MLQKLGFISLLAIGLVLVFPSGDPHDVAKLATDAVPALAPSEDEVTNAEGETAVKSPTKAPAPEADEVESFVMGSPVVYSEDDDGEEDIDRQAPSTAPAPSKPGFAKPKSGGKGKYRPAPKNTRQPPEMV